MTGTLFTTPRWTPVNNDGVPRAGAKLYFYRAGTATPASVFSSASLAVPLSHPVVANAFGAFSAIYLDPNSGYHYKAILTDSAGVQLWSEDNIPAGPQLTAALVGEALWPISDAESLAGVTPTNYAYPPGDVRRYGADSTGATDSSAAVGVAFSVGIPVYFPSGTYAINSTVTVDDALVSVHGDGDSSILDLSGGGKLYLKSTLAGLPALSAAVNGGTDVLTFASAHGLAEGDVVVAYNPTDYSFGAARTYYRDGCMFRASTITSTTAIKTYGVSPATYAHTAVSMYKLNGGRVSLSNFRLIPPSSGIGLWIDAHQGVRLEGLTIDSGADDTAVEIYRCFDVDVKNVKATARAGNGYPLAIANSQKVTISNCALYSTRHCLLLGGRSEAGAVPTRNILIDQCVLENDGTLGIGAADMHGNCEDVIYDQCIINSHAQMSGKNAAYIGCKIYGRPAAYYADGSCIYGSEISGGTFRIENCEFVTWGDLTSFGAIHLSVKDITEDFRLVVHAGRIENKATAPTTARVVTLVIGDSAPPSDWINVDIRDLTYKANSPASQLLYLSGSNDISANCTIIIDDILAPSESAFVGASNATNYTVPMRLQAQCYSETLTTPGSSAAFITSSEWTYRYPYPRIPTITVSAGSSDGTTLQTAVRGGKVVVPFARQYTTQAAYIAVHSSDNANFGSSEAVRVHGRVEICDL